LPQPLVRQPDTESLTPENASFVNSSPFSDAIFSVHSITERFSTHKKFRTALSKTISLVDVVFQNVPKASRGGHIALCAQSFEGSSLSGYLKGRNPTAGVFENKKTQLTDFQKVGYFVDPQGFEP
jgi:hypothetical protein